MAFFVNFHMVFFLCLDISPNTNKNLKYVKVKVRGPDAINNLISEICNSDITRKLTLNLRANLNENYKVLTTAISKAMEKSMSTKLVKFNIKNLIGLRKVSVIQILTEIKCTKKLKETPQKSTAYLNLRVSLRSAIKY